MLDYRMTSEEFLNFKMIIQDLYLKFINSKNNGKLLKNKIINKLEYFKLEGFIDYYKINKINKKNLEIIINLGNELYNIKYINK